MMAIATLETQPRNHAFPYRKIVAPVDPTVALSVSFSDLVPDPAAVLTWTFTVLRSGDRAPAISVGWAIAPGGSPMPASTFVGGAYPTGTVALAAGVTSGTGSFQTAAGGQPAADQFATLALLNPAGCTLGSPASASLRLPGKVIPTQDQVSVACPDTSWTVDAATHDHLVTVSRSNSLGTFLAGSQVTLALVGTGGNPIVAADVSGGLLNATVVFAAGETSKPYTITTLAGVAPAADKTGRVAISAPVGCQLAAFGTQVDVAIQHGVVTPPTGVLPPQYTDPNWTGMSAYSTASITTPITNRADLLAAAGALSNNVLCKTKYIELAASFNDTGTLNLNFKGYVDTSATPNKIYPLIIRSVLANIGDRTRISSLAHFRHIDLNNATWVWLHGLAAEFPITGTGSGNQYQTDNSPAILMSGSTDCIVTRCWLDAPQGVYSTNGVRPRVGACDFYGTVRKFNENDWFTQFRLHQTGPTWGQQSRTVRGWFYQNYLGQVRERFAGLLNGNPAAGCGAFYSGDGVPPAGNISPAIDYPNVPYDLNCRETWFFNNLLYTPIGFIIYNKGALNIWRNRVVSTDTHNEADTGNPQGNAFHYIAVRGGNCTMAPEPPSNPAHSAATCSVCYNSCEGKTGHNDIQCWHFVAEFNDWGGIPLNLFMACDRHDPSKPKTLLAANHARFRGNKGGEYQIGSSRNSAYEYQAPLLDCSWEGEDAGTRWTWENTYSFKDGGVTKTVTYDLSGQVVAFDAATGLNTKPLKVTFPGDSTKVACAAGQLKKTGSNTAVRELTTASKNADYTGEFTRDKKGVQAKDANCLVWDYVGEGGGGGGGDEPANYDLISDNMTVWWPSDDMPADYVNSSVSFIAGGGLEIKAQATPTPHACINVWHKKRPPDGDCVFTFYATKLDALDSGDASAEGIFALFRVRQKGAGSFPANPNKWTSGQWRPVAPYAYVTPGSDNMVRDRTTGYRHSFANHADITKGSMQFRCRISTDVGVNNGADDSIQLTDPTVPNPVPDTGDSFMFAKDVKYKLVYTRTGNTVSCTKTNTADSTTQTWTFVDARLGAAGQGLGGWCGFYSSLGRWIRIEPVPGIPFCSGA